MGKVIINKFAGTCQTCSVRVAAGAGVAVKDGTRWAIKCTDHKGETHGATNPWRDAHRTAERDFCGGEYSYATGRARVDSEYNSTDSLAEPCPTCGGTCHWRATVGARQCPDCRTMIAYHWNQAKNEMIRKIIKG